MVITPSSSGCLSVSSVLRSNSGSSSRNNTPLCASDISPGRGILPPPIRPTAEAVCDTLLNGRTVTIGFSRSSIPAIECIPVVSILSSNVIGGRIDGIRFAIMLFPVPGGPMRSTLWKPAAATSRA